MSVILYDPVEERHVLELEEGSWAGKHWFADLRICDNPFCSCNEITFQCVPADGDFDSHAAPVSFRLDTLERSVHRSAGSGDHPVSDGLAEAVTKELGDSGWKYLRDFFLGVKQEQIENCDPRRSDAEFPPEVLRGDATVAGYVEVFPLAGAFLFKIDSVQWAALDSYCVNPECDCHHVVLQFTEVDTKRGVLFGPRKHPPAMYYDYKARTFEVARAPAAHQPPLETLLAALRNQRAGFDVEVKKRHRKLRALFKRALRRYEAEADRKSRSARDCEPAEERREPAGSPVAKTGRNDPCPCGSGKKYKKCCGR